jgi:SWIM zinc finger
MISASPATPVQCTARRGGRDPVSVELNSRADGSFGAVSCNGQTISTVRLSPASCTCLDWQHYERCCHVTAAQQARVCCWCGVTSAAVAVFVNGWDNGAELALCPACFTPKAVRP